MRMSTKVRRPRLEPSARAELLRAYRDRQGSQAEFCRERGLAVSTLQYWLRRERPRAEFIELKSPLMAAGEWALAVELAQGTAIKAAEGVDPRWLAAIVSALRCGA